MEIKKNDRAVLINEVLTVAVKKSLERTEFIKLSGGSEEMAAILYNDLKKDGFVKPDFEVGEKRVPIKIGITEKGRDFINNGGYTL